MPVIDFLSQPTEDLIRKQVQNIKDSYSHPWDVLSELLQNSVDGIRRLHHHFPHLAKEHQINIALDSGTKSIEVSDTGIGFPRRSLQKLLSLHGTDKSHEPEEIGQKGIGLKFAVFSSDEFELDSKSIDGRIHGTITGALTWVDRGVGQVPTFSAEELSDDAFSPDLTGCTVKLKKVEDRWEGSDSIFGMGTNRLVHLLRTKTAVGNTRLLLGLPDINPIVKLDHLDPDNKRNRMSVQFLYQFPTELIAQNDLRDYREFVEKAAALDDRQKAKELGNKTLHLVGTSAHAGRSIRYIACFVPNRDTWNQISKKVDPKSVGAEIDSDSQDDENPVMSGGIYLATRGMPTGIDLVPPYTGGAGYWPNTFILIEDDGLEFDLGRKSVPRRTQTMLKDVAKEVFNKFLKYYPYIVGSSKTRLGPSAVFDQKRQETFDELEKLNDLGLRSIGFLKYPDGQEAAVVAIFHELVGGGLLPGYKGLRQGYKSMYDMWGKYQIDTSKIGERLRSQMGPKIDLRIVVEFKHNCEAIIPDVQANRKFFEDIDLVVSWDIDERKFNKEGIQVRILPPEDVFFYGSNYVLEWPGAYNLGSRGTKPVLALRKFVEDLVAGKG